MVRTSQKSYGFLKSTNEVAERFSRDSFNIDEFPEEKVTSCFGVG